MRFRKLRIAWSVGCLLIAIPLCVLWGRSHQYWERVVIGIGGTRAIEVQHVLGQVKIIAFSEQHITPGFQPATSPFWPQLKLSTDEWSKQDRRRSDNGLPTDFPASPIGFGGEITPTRCVVFVPHRFLVCLAVLSAAAVWAPWRFSLRTLLFATTLVAVVLCIIVWSMRAGS